MLSYGKLFCCVFCALITLVAVSGCIGGNGTSPQADQPALSAKLVKPGDNGVLERWLKAELVKAYRNNETRTYYAALGTVTATGELTVPAVTDTAAAPQMSGNSAAAADSYSKTNVQESGVDESDLVKTDGNYLYLVRGSRFIVLNRHQQDIPLAIVKEIDLGEHISELHLNGGLVTLITASYSAVPLPANTATSSDPTANSAASIALAMPGTVRTRVYNYDITVPETPVLSSRLDFPGFLQGSRRINNTLYLITNYHIDLPNPVSLQSYLPNGKFSFDAYHQGSAAAAAENIKRIEALTLADMIPSYSRTVYAGGSAGLTSASPVVASGEVFIPEYGNGTDLSLVIAIDNSTSSPTVTCSGVISSWCSIYLSPDSLYLASGNSWAWIEPVQGSDTTVKPLEPWTALHKFSLSGGVGAPVYKGSGTVTGWLNNQFSMSEYNGYLRIGTTRGGWWGEGISNRLAVLAEQEGVLVEKGQIEGLAQGERIYSMRFDRDRGYMVTFRQTDPLFTFDLSDPLNPRTTGELKVDGFATYIQVVGSNNNRLLTIGRSADSNGRVTGNKLQLFDVTKLSDPVLLGSYELGNGWSAALYDHHAFLYYENLGILAIPYYDYGNAGSYSSGLKVFAISDSSISLRGDVPAKTFSSSYDPYTDTVDRAVIIGTDIYAIAHRSVTVADTGNLEVKRTIDLPEWYAFSVLTGQTGGVTPVL
jgi:uncharacterized secreted protein with C-terminal beta-propeller domain